MEEQFSTCFHWITRTSTFCKWEECLGCWSMLEHSSKHLKPTICCIGWKKNHTSGLNMFIVSFCIEIIGDKQQIQQRLGDFDWNNVWSQLLVYVHHPGYKWFRCSTRQKEQFLQNAVIYLTQCSQWGFGLLKNRALRGGSDKITI